MQQSETELVDIAPDVGLILADLERERFEWEGAIAELLDNSLDANATRVTIEIDKKQGRVAAHDNGDGCKVEPHRMFISGDTTKKRSVDKVGRYGVGFKHASYYLARRDGSTTVVTSTGGVHRSIAVCWDDIIKRGAWKVHAATTLTDAEARVSLPELRGTCITFRLGKGRRDPANAENLIRALSFTFSPALRNGRQVEIRVGGAKPRLLAAPRDPIWTESIDVEVRVEHRTARVRAGLLSPEDKSGRRGLSYGFAHRIILQDTVAGCGDGVYGTEGFAGFVDLDSHWRLGQNKSAVTDDAWQQLQDAILEKVRPLLEKLRNATHQLHSEAIRVATADLLNACLGRGGARRPGKRGEKRDRSGSDSGRDRVRKAAIVSGLGDVDGRVLGAAGKGGKTRGGCVSIQWEDRPEASYAARVDQSCACVYLNRAKSVVAEAEAKGNRDLLAIIAGCHLFHVASKTRLWGDGEFADMMGGLLSKPLSLTVAAASA